MDDADKQEIASIVNAVLDARMGVEPTPAPTHTVDPFRDAATEATAQRVCTYMRNNPGVTTAGIVKALGLPKHWFRNPKVLASGVRVTPTRDFMLDRALTVAPDVPTGKPRVATPKAALRATPEQAQARRAVAIRVAEHLQHALDDGLASGLLFEKAKSTRTIRSLVAQVRLRGGVTQ